jgi:membrane protease YdiL (CAAX protease family)
VLSIGVGCVLAPFAEEVLFRGYLFGQLYRRARWGFWLSALIPSALFALGHAYQAGGPLELAGIFAVTGLGGLLGCWLFLRWQCNLWTVFGLHCLMNLWWGGIRCSRHRARRLDCQRRPSSHRHHRDSPDHLQRSLLEAAPYRFE